MAVQDAKSNDLFAIELNVSFSGDLDALFEVISNVAGSVIVKKLE